MLAAALALVLVAEPTTEVNKVVEVAPAEQTVLQFPGLTRIAVGDPGIADVHVDGAQVLVTGKAEGRTTLIAWTAQGRDQREIRVTLRKASQLEQLLHAFAGGEDLRVLEVGEKRVVQGHVPSFEALERVKRLVASESDVVLLVDVPRASRAEVVERINDALSKAGLRGAHAEQVGDRIFLEGTVDDEAESRRAQLIAESVLGGPLDAPAALP